MELFYRIALGMVYGIGPRNARRLLEFAGSAEAVFNLKRNQVLSIPGMGPVAAERLLDRKVFERAKQELEYIRKHKISCIFIEQEAYPRALKECEDAPLLLYSRGSMNELLAEVQPGLTGRKILSIVGTRRPSRYGLDVCKRLVADLAEKYPELVIVSGLAYGIDVCAHKAALEGGLDTIAVMGHGFRHMYPAIHRQVAGRIETAGALLTDFASFEKPERNNFIKRNRIIAGLSEATIVVESGARGGALVTADLANSYNRDVYAFPGRAGDPSAAGCNNLIKSHRAALISNSRDLEYFLGWDEEEKQSRRAPEPCIELNPLQQEILEIISSESNPSIDLISAQTGKNLGVLSGILLDLELQGLIKAVPGNCYSIRF